MSKIGKLVAHNLKRLRDLQGLSQEQLAERADNMNPAHLSHIETQRRTPRPKTIARLARALNVPEEEFYRPAEDGTAGELEIKRALGVIQQAFSVTDQQLLQEIMSTYSELRSEKRSLFLLEAASTVLSKVPQMLGRILALSKENEELRTQLAAERDPGKSAIPECRIAKTPVEEKLLAKFRVIDEGQRGLFFQVLEVMIDPPKGLEEAIQDLLAMPEFSHVGKKS